MVRKDIGRCRLPDLLAKRGWTQLELSRRTGISNTQISDFATNRRIMSLPTAMLIAGTLRCSVEDLYEGIQADDLDDE